MKKKIVRIYPLYLICLLFSMFVAVWIGNNININDFVGNLLFLQDTELKPGNWFNCFGGNHVIWYMSYQWWDYVMFILLVTLVRNRKNWLWVTAATSSIGMLSYMLVPNHASILLWYFWIFYLGLHLGECYVDKKNVNPWVAVVTIAMLVVWHCVEGIPRGVAIGVHPYLETRHFLVALILLSAFALMKKFHLHRVPGITLFKVFAPFSLSIYIFQIPTLYAMNNLFGESITTTCLSVVVTLCVAYLIEVHLQKVWLKYLK